MFYRISMQIGVHDVFAIEFLVLRAMIRYHIMIPLSSLTSLIGVPHQIFANMACMILVMILPLWLV
jgi:hypothetical protein